MMLRPFLLLLCVYQSRGQAPREEVVTGIGIKLCNQKCVERGSCMSFAYDIDRLACHLLHSNSVKWTKGYIIHPKQGTQFSCGSLAKCGFNTRCVERHRGGGICVKGLTVTSTLESRCTKDSDCPVPRKFVCFTKTCKCVPGYSYNPASGNCVRRCKTYGNGLTIYQGLGIKKYNDRTEVDTTEKGCSNTCLREKLFTCVSFDYSDEGVCHISKTGYLDVEDSMRETGQQGWILAVRNCA